MFRDKYLSILKAVFPQEHLFNQSIFIGYPLWAVLITRNTAGNTAKLLHLGSLHFSGRRQRRRSVSNMYIRRCYVPWRKVWQRRGMRNAGMTGGEGEEWLQHLVGQGRRTVKEHFSKDLMEVRKPAIQVSRGWDFQAKGTARVKSLMGRMSGMFEKMWSMWLE